jgi:hypothetical protein
MANGIDFMAIARGRERALADNYADIRRMQEQEQYRFKREEQMNALEDQRFNRAATTYTSPWLANMQRLTKSGKNEVDAYLENQQLVLNDPGFQGLPPEVQQRVQQQIADFSTPIVQRLVAARDFGGLERLAAGAGVTTPIDALTRAAQTGDPTKVLATFGLTPDAEGMVVVPGTNLRVPAADAAQAVLQAQSPAGLIGAGVQSRLNAENQAAAQAQLSRQRAFAEVQLITSGYEKLPDGNFRSKENPAVVISLDANGTPIAPTSLSPMTGGSAGSVVDAAFGAPAGVAAPGVAAPVANNMAPSATPATSLSSSFANLLNSVNPGANLASALSPGLRRLQGVTEANRTATELDIQAGQNDASAIAHLRKSPAQLAAVLSRLVSALKTEQNAERIARIQAAIDRFKGVE